jgi:drug/metabolite transporter (DMT)-like permease
VWQILVFTTIPYVIIQWASRYADEMIATIYDGVVEPLTGAILSWIIFKDATTVLQVVGGMIMILSFVFAAIFSRRHFLIKHMLGMLRGIRK